MGLTGRHLNHDARVRIDALHPTARLANGPERRP